MVQVKNDQIVLKVSQERRIYFNKKTHTLTLKLPEGSNGV